MMMLDEGQRWLQRESDIALAVRGPDYSQRDEALRKVNAERTTKKQTSDEAHARRIAGFWEQVSRGEVGYRPGHPWYYVLGGTVLMPKEILAAVKASGYQGYMSEMIAKTDNKPEPQRSESLRQIRDKVRGDLKSDLGCYCECTRKLRRYHIENCSNGHAPVHNEIHTSISLKHNHIYNDFAHLLRLDELLAQQPDLFG